MTKEEAKEKIKLLIDKFNSQIEFYKSLNYNETKTRQDFINPFFKALGWDIDNDKQILETYRNVSHEDKIKVNGHTKSPDYSFGINGKRIFFVEAKRPAVPIRENPEPALQVRNYGWNAKLSISIVTDFEEFAIYDCTRKPKPTENANTKRLKYIYFTDYLKEFDFIYDTFSYENVENNSIEKYAKSKINYKTAEPVDKEFLKSIEKWREGLAANIAFRNRDLEEEEINFSVQQIIDRIVFLKVCEDRKVESENNLFFVTKSGYYYQNLYEYFQKADQKYNSGLFDFKKDTITKDLEIDNTVIKNIIIELYGKSQITDKEYGYNFAIIPVEILGMAYEQFLGKVIRLTTAHQAKIEEKPEVRKAGGVFYTPEYIVEYIVKNTVGKQIANKTPEEISKFKILDPACGSGSFLLGAYQYLLNYHQNYYLKNLKGKITKDSPINQEGFLTTAEKKRILLNNIFGVDIDLQAVEVTKLSLLIKAMEGETTTSIETSLQLFHQRVLPSLDNNILSGNSLISPDFEGLGLTPKEERKINVFDWKESFKDIFKTKNGFDVVIGNPPYVFTRDVEWGESVKNYFWNNFAISNGANKSKKNQSGKVNLYILFILKALHLINENGLLSFIVPNGLLRTTTYDTTRKYLLNNTAIDLIVDLKDGVFAGVTASTIIFQLAKFRENNKIKIIDANYKKDKIIDDSKINFIPQDNLKKNTSFAFNIFVNETENEIFNRVQSSKLYLKDITVDIIEGIVAHKEYLSNKKVDKNYKEMLEGKDLKRFAINYGGNYVLFDREKLHRARPDYLWQAEKKVLIQRISGGKKPLVAAIDTQKYLSFASINNLLIKPEFVSKYSYELICAILNSNLINFYYSKNFTNSSTLTVNISKTFLEMIPLPPIDTNDKIQESNIKLISENVTKLAAYHIEMKTINIPQQQELLKRKILHSEKQINELVYKIYGLNSIDIELIEKE